MLHPRAYGARPLRRLVASSEFPDGTRHLFAATRI